MRARCMVHSRCDFSFHVVVDMHGCRLKCSQSIIHSLHGTGFPQKRKRSISFTSENVTKIWSKGLSVSTIFGGPQAYQVHQRLVPWDRGAPFVQLSRCRGSPGVCAVRCLVFGTLKGFATILHTCTALQVCQHGTHIICVCYLTIVVYSVSRQRLSQ